MKRIKTIKFIISMLVILNVAVLFSQSTTKAFKFLYCAWGSSPEVVINNLREVSPDIDIKEDTALKEEEKAIGIREFGKREFQFGDFKWTLTLRFLDDKLVEVSLIRFKVKYDDKKKISEELEAKFGEHKTIPGIDTKVWKAEDGSELSMLFLETGTETLGDSISITYTAPGFSAEHEKRKKEYLKKKKTIW